MRIENKQLKEFLADSGLVASQDLENLVSEADQQNKQLGNLLLEKKLIDEIQLRKLYAYILGVPFVDLKKETITPDILQIVPEPIARKYKV
ncbi:MAG TPA: hypothetical protein VK469_21220, partial [Candidatus Kapabacteria bacterium]|nr:hypothetical protein [Candidatus Kapabacteria bacterium]